MRESSPEAPELDARLEEIDRKLREIQSELAPEVEERAAPELEPPPPPSPDLADDQLGRLTALHTSLLSSMTEVLGQLHSVVAQASRPPEVTVSAGPFASIEAVRAFEQELARLPGVHHVAVRGYEGEDRAVIDVQLSPPTT